MTEPEFNIELKDITGKSFEFKSQNHALDFLRQEIAFWSETNSKLGQSGKPLPPSVVNTLPLERIIKTIDTYSDVDHKLFDTKLRNETSLLHKLWIWSGHPFIDHIIKCNIEHSQTAAKRCLDILTHPDTNYSSGGIQELWGALYAFDFLHNQQLADDSSDERLSSHLHETYQSLMKEVEEFRTSLKIWQDGAKSDWDSLYKESEKLLKSVAKKNDEELTTFKGEKVSDLNAFIDEHNSKFEDYISSKELLLANFVEAKTKDIEILEQTYEDKLRLEKPAQYWNKASKKFNTQGYIGSAILFALSLIGVVIFYKFYGNYLAGQESKINLDTIKGIVLFGTGVASYAYLIRAVAKFTFSCFHLQRDAEEREQLTYLYLSLSQGGNVSEQSKEIILQALFSRSETGLLGTDSSPTMPSNILDILKSSKN